MTFHLTLPEELLEFRSTVRAFLDEHLPPASRRGVELNVASMFEPEVSRPWHDILYRHGLAAPGWPTAHGGRDWDALHQYIWRMECWRARAPAISPFGMRLVAPALFHFGSDDQRREFLPRLLSGEDYWCQGFSEPGAGSDLAGLACQARQDGDDYVLNGTKIWQTHAHHANWMITLVRTGTDGRPQDGVTCLLVDLSTPGVSIRPILTIGSDHEVNQVFFDDARIPVVRRVGDEGQGWAITKFLLEEERRSAGNAVGRLRYSLGGLLRLLEADSGRWNEAGIQARIGRIAADLDVLEIVDLEQLLGGAEAFDASLMKLRASLLEQDIAETAVLALGADALRWVDERPLERLQRPDAELEALAAMPRHLNARARTIYGGATEVQLDILQRTMR